MIKAKLMINKTGCFKGSQYKVMKNSDGFFRIQMNHHGYWQEVTPNDTATFIVGKGSTEPQIFTTQIAVEEFIHEYFERGPEKEEEPKEVVIKQDWEEAWNSGDKEAI